MSVFQKPLSPFIER